MKRAIRKLQRATYPLLNRAMVSTKNQRYAISRLVDIAVEPEMPVVFLFIQRQEANCNLINTAATQSTNLIFQYFSRIPDCFITVFSRR